MLFKWYIERITGSVHVSKERAGKQYVKFIGALQKDFGCIVMHHLENF